MKMQIWIIYFYEYRRIKLKKKTTTTTTSISKLRLWAARIGLDSNQCSNQSLMPHFVSVRIYTLYRYTFARDKNDTLMATKTKTEEEKTKSNYRFEIIDLLKPVYSAICFGPNVVSLFDFFFCFFNSFVLGFIFTNQTHIIWYIHMLYVQCSDKYQKVDEV